MNVAVLTVPPAESLARILMERALEQHILLGMPHLAPTGLSETWLMKELGHRHWLMLARHLGMSNADFRTDNGEEAYAAICATSLKAKRFDLAQANDILTVTSTFSPVSRTQTATRHVLAIAGNLIGEVELISAFVYRQAKDDNHSIARVALASQDAQELHPSSLAQIAAGIRSGRLRAHLGMAADTATPLNTFFFTPSPSQEFNGAGLLYFANFQSIVDRALESWFSRGSMPYGFSRRDIFFSGNARPGENLRIEMAFFEPDEGRMICRIRRSDLQVIAHVFMANTWRDSE